MSRSAGEQDALPGSILATRALPFATLFLSLIAAALLVDLLLHRFGLPWVGRDLGWIGELPPLEVARRLDERGIFVWDGNYYAIAVTERLGLEATGGMVRIGIVHYNTPGEVERLLLAVDQLSA